MSEIRKLTAILVADVRRDGALTLSDVRGPTLGIACEP
jgi:hypothetical protein